MISKAKRERLARIARVNKVEELYGYPLARVEFFLGWVVDDEVRHYVETGEPGWHMIKQFGREAW